MDMFEAASTVIDNAHEIAADHSRKLPPAERKQLIKAYLLAISSSERLSIPQSELAKRFGVNQSTISRIEKELEAELRIPSRAEILMGVKTLAIAYIRKHPNWGAGRIVDAIDEQIGQRTSDASIRNWKKELDVERSDFVIDRHGHQRSRPNAVITGSDIPLISGGDMDSKALVVWKGSNALQLYGRDVPLVGKHPYEMAKRRFSSKPSARTSLRSAMIYMARHIYGVSNPTEADVWDLPLWAHGYDQVSEIKAFFYEHSDLERGSIPQYYGGYLAVVKCNYRENRISQREWNAIEEDYPIDQIANLQHRFIDAKEWRRAHEIASADPMVWAMLTCCYPLGMRNMQIAHMKVSDINLGAGKAGIVTAIAMKGGYAPQIHLLHYPRGTANVLQNWLRIREQEAPDHDCLFCQRSNNGVDRLWHRPLGTQTSKNRKQLDAGTVGNVIGRILNQARINKSEPHCGRVSAENELRRAKVDEATRRVFFGWKSESSQVKYSRVGIDDLEGISKPEWGDLFRGLA